MLGIIKKGLLISLIAAVSGCAATPMKSDVTLPVIQQAPRTEMYDAKIVRDSAAGSGLWKEANYRGFFTDMRARRVGDLITVNIVESSRASKKADTSSSRDSSIDAGISNLLGYETKLDKIGVPGAFNASSMFKANLTNSHAGSGATSRDESMTAYLTARVVDVMHDGNLILKGTREVRVNNETQFITLTGIVRPADISPNNTILSSYIADARITYTGRGAVSDKQKPGLITRAVDFIWPF